jgi:hypothetical protein
MSKKAGFYVVDKDDNVLSGPHAHMHGDHNEQNQEDSRVIAVAYKVLVTQVQEYIVLGMTTEEKAKKAACCFAVGNTRAISECVSVIHGEVHRNEAVECSLTII